jgi:hypothetical protein
MDTVKIFISHSSRDSDIARLFSNFLESLSVNIKVFCSSIEGHIRIGNDFIETIMSNLSASSLFIPLISPNFLQSKFCLVELGVAWAYLFEKHKTRNQETYILPFSVPPVERGNALQDTPLRNLQALPINALHASFHDFVAVLNGKGANIQAGANELCIKFTNDVTEKLAGFGGVLDKANWFTFNAADKNGGEMDFLSCEKTSGGFALSYDRDHFTCGGEYPEYAGFVLQYPGGLNLFNVTCMFKNVALAGTVRTDGVSVNNIDVEIKYSEANKILHKETFPLVPGENTVSVPLAPLAARSAEAMQRITEICFIFKPKYFEAPKGRFEINDIGIRY